MSARKSERLLNLLNELENNTFAELVMRNTDLGDDHSTALPGNLFSAFEMPQLEMDISKQLGADPVSDDPFLGGVVRSAGYLSNSDSDGLVDDCARDLRAGRPLIIFPEGTRTWPGEPLGFQRGAAYIALRSGAPVLPVLIDCLPSTLTRREKWYQIPPRPFHLRIKVLDPLQAERWVSPGEAQTIAARKLTRALEEFFVLELAKWIR